MSWLIKGINLWLQSIQKITSMEILCIKNHRIWRKLSQGIQFML